MDHNDILTINARTRGWEIFAPDWDHFRQIPALPLGALCALSVGLTPSFASPGWVLYTALPHFDGSDPDEFFCSGLDDPHVNSYRAALLKAFWQRTHWATGNLAPLGVLPIAVGEPDSLNTMVRVSDFIAWARLQSPAWVMPADFGIVESSALAAPIANGPTARPMPQQRHQEAEILRVIGELGYLAKSLPTAPPGKPGPKAKVRAMLTFSPAQFDKAWERLRNQNDIGWRPYSPKLG